MILMFLKFIVFFVIPLAAISCTATVRYSSAQTTTPQTTQPVSSIKTGFSFSGIASFYGPGFHGRRTASGEIFNQNALTAAHRTLPFGTRVEVTNKDNGKSVIVTINDRGPFKRNRVIDLSKRAAEEIGMIQSGLANVDCVVVE